MSNYRKKRERPFVELKSVVETRNPAPVDLDLTLRWHLIYTSPRGEARAAKGLAEAGCKVFWPSRHKVIRFGRREITHDVATFPRYLFAAGVPFREQRFDQVQADRTVVTVNGRPIDDIRDIDGVQDVVGTSAGWLRVPGAAIRAVADYQNSVEPPPPPPARVAPGQRVTVIEGPFISFQAVVVEAIGLAEAEVLIEIFGRATRMRIDIGHLDAA